MKRVRFALASICAAALLAACGGGGDGNQAPTVQYSKMVVFGDSLSDVGTYATAGMKAIGGQYVGKYTVNGPNGLNWTEVLADLLKVARPCPNEVGLTSSGPLASLAQAPSFNTSCFSYAQGGARVENPVGPLNSLAVDSATHSELVGQLTVPITTQIDTHITNVGQFGDNDLVIVWAGANDLFMNLAALSAYQTAYATSYLTTYLSDPANVAPLQAICLAKTPPPGSAPAMQACIQAEALKVPSVVAAITTAVTNYLVSTDQTVDGTTHAPNGLTGAMVKAADKLADRISYLLTKGAKRVVVLNVPDASTSPYIVGAGASQPASVLVTAFNNRLKYDLFPPVGASSDVANKVLFIDAYAQSQNQHNNPSAYGLTNVTGSACNTTSAPTNVVGSSLMCNENNLNTANGVTVDNYNTYLFSDGNHPTPYGHRLTAQLVAGKMAARGWF